MGGHQSTTGKRSSKNCNVCLCLPFQKGKESAITLEVTDIVDHHPSPAFVATDQEKATHNSITLQNFVDAVCTESMNGLKFSVTVASPLLDDCPLVHCSIGFSELTGYLVEEIVGRNCRFLLDGVPEHLIRPDTRIKCRSFCACARDGSSYTAEEDKMPESLRENTAFRLPDGEILCVQANARKNGDLFSNMFYLREVELDDDTFILGLQAEMPEDYDHLLHDVGSCFADSYMQLTANMDALEKVLANEFWYSGPMRRQYS